jgi:hypothetical protein
MAFESERPTFVQIGAGSGRYSPLLMELMILHREVTGQQKAANQKDIRRSAWQSQHPSRLVVSVAV